MRILIIFSFIISSVAGAEYYGYSKREKKAEFGVENDHFKYSIDAGIRYNYVNYDFETHSYDEFRYIDIKVKAQLKGTKKSFVCQTVSELCYRSDFLGHHYHQSFQYQYYDMKE